MSKLDLAVTFLYWTIRFIYCDDIESKGAGKKEADYFIVLVEYLRSDVTTEPVRDNFL